MFCNFFTMGGGMCSPIYMCLITGVCRRAESGEISPVGDQCESACEDQGKSDELESFIRGRQYLRETFKFHDTLIQ